jgi:thiopurine S-methyltransferase
MVSSTVDSSITHSSTEKGADVKAQFWHERWESGQLGFHQSEVNPRLVQYWPRLSLAEDASVFVPLCGKSLDMHWIRSQGHPVIGIDLSPIAIKAFFDEAGIARAEEGRGELCRFSGSGFGLFSGDFFDLEASDLRSVRGVYDRGSLIALPPEMRERYAAKMIEILPEEARILLMTIEYDQSKMSGPPHSVTPSEVASLFGINFEIETLLTSELSDPGPHFKERGLDASRQHVMLLTRRLPNAQRT